MTTLLSSGSASDRSIEGRTSRGAVSAIAMSAASAPFAIGITIILGRISPGTLGFYALVTLLIGVVSALLSLGGPAVAARFTPTLGRVPNAVTALQAVAGAAISFLGAGILLVIDHRPFGVPWWGVGCLAVAVPVWVGMQGAYTSDLRFGRATAIQNLPTLFQFLFLGVLTVVVPETLRRHANQVVVISYVIPIGLLALVYLVTLARARSGRSFSTRLPTGFWPYAGGVQVIVVLAFLFEMTERGAAALHGGGLVTLGKYFAALQTAQIVRRVPTIVGQAYLPGFAALAGDVRSHHLHRDSARVVGLIGFSVGTALAMSKGLVGPVFGTEYHSASMALAVLALAYAATAATPLDCSYATANGRLVLYQVALLVGSLAFLPLVWFGSVGAFALSRATAVVALQLVVVGGVRRDVLRRGRHMIATVALGGAEVGVVDHIRSPGVAAVVWLVGLVAYRFSMGGGVPTLAGLRRTLPRPEVERP